jgi:hypothetical protein
MILIRFGYYQQYGSRSGARTLIAAPGLEPVTIQIRIRFFGLALFGLTLLHQQYQKTVPKTIFRPFS